MVTQKRARKRKETDRLIYGNEQAGLVVWKADLKKYLKTKT